MIPYEVLRLVVEFRERLQEIWDDALISREGALAQLRELCVRAENSGVQALTEFARRLSAYAPAQQA